MRRFAMKGARTAVLTAACVATSLLAAGGASAGGPLPPPKSGGDIAFTADYAGDLAIYHLAKDLGQLFDPNPKPLADSNLLDWGPAYDPTGEWLAFTSTRTGNSDIWTMRWDGSQQTQVTNDAGGDQYPSWFANGGRLAYMSEDPVGGDTEISAINVDGTNKVPLTDNAENDLIPAVSPNGMRIAYAQQSQGIRVMGIDGSNDAQVPNTSSLALAPRWLGNDQLVFTEGFGMNNQVFRINLDGSGKTPLTSGSQDALPVPSPAGDYITFQRNVGGEFKLFGMTVGGENEGPLEGLDITVQPAGMDQQARERVAFVADVIALRGQRLRAEFEASENAELFIKAFISFGGGGRAIVPLRARKAKFKPVTVDVAENKVKKVKLKASSKARKAIAGAAEEGDKLKVTLTATATDDVGDSSKVKVTRKLKPKG